MDTRSGLWLLGGRGFVKIAFVALPQSDTAITMPPIPVSYAAAVLEQQRHIVRIYDLAVRGSNSYSDPLGPLRAFRPHIIAITPGDDGVAQDVVACGAGWDARVVHLAPDLRVEWEARDGGRRLALGEQSGSGAEEAIILDTVRTLCEPLDRLPFPARHLLALEQYHLFTLGHELQTPLLVGRHRGVSTELRNPALIVSELRSVTHEHGVLHFALEGVPLTHDLAWLQSLLQHLTSARLGVAWEGAAAYEALSPEMLRACRAAGCEAVRFSFDAMTVLDEKPARDLLTRAVELAHAVEISVRAHIFLEPRFSSVPALVDIAATFGLDDVQFFVGKHTAEVAAADWPAADEIAELAHSHYQSSRSRQYFINRFGTRLGTMIWRVGRTGLLGRVWQQAAVGGEVLER
jgi:hypothetical protein